MHVVLDPHTAPPRPIDAGFHRHNRSLNERTFSRFGQSRRFMDFEPDTVAKAVPEQLPKTAVLNVAARYSIGIPPRHSRTHEAHSSLVCEPHHVVYFALLVVGSADNERARNVGTIAIDARAEVDEQE